MNEASAIGDATDSAAQDSKGAARYEKMDTDAAALLAYVSNIDFPSNGNLLGAPVSTMQDDCP